MKSFFLLFLSFFSIIGYAQIEIPEDPLISPQKSPSKTNSGIITFTNGDHLQGTFISANFPHSIKWNGINTIGPVDFSIDKLDTIFLDPEQSLQKNSEVSQVVCLDGSIFNGKIISYTTKQTVIMTDFAKAVTINPKNIKSITFLNENNINTVNDFNKNWTILSGKCVPSENGISLIKKSLIIRKIDPTTSFSMDLIMNKSAQMSIGFLTDNIEYLYTNEQTGIGITYTKGELFINDTFIPLSETKSASKENSTIQYSLLFDNQKSKIFITDSKGSKIHTIDLSNRKKGNLLIISTDNICTFRKLQVTPWICSENKKTGEKDSIILSNHDTIDGSIESISENKLFIKSESGDLTIPLDRILYINFSTNSPSKQLNLEKKNIPTKKRDNQQSDNENYNVQAFFNSSNYIFLNIQSIQDGKIVATSPLFGKITAELASFSKLKFSKTIKESTKQSIDNP